MEIQKVENIQFIKSLTPKKQIVIGNITYPTVTAYLAKLKRHTYETSDVPHYMISSCGTIYNLFNDKYFSTYVDTDDCEQSITIGLFNSGILYKQRGKYFNIFMNEVPVENVEDKSFKGQTHWEKYTEPQIKALQQLIEYLCEKMNIVPNIVDSHAHLTMKHSFNVLYRSNLDNKYFDINPILNLNNVSHEP